jgi:tagatose-1,6-bisphosphate aldolase
MRKLSVGKYRGLQQCSTEQGALAVLALDHRNNLRNALKPGRPESVTDSEMMDFKQQVARILSPAASAILLDPQVGAAQCIAAGALDGRVGLITSMEATGYAGNQTERLSKILPGWSVCKARRMGANAVKLLVYYHPRASTAKSIESLVEEVAKECVEQDIPFLLEPLSYSMDPNEKKLASIERREVIIETAHRLTISGVDVLKAEFPVDIRTELDEHIWAEACAEISSASKAPWVLLSASVDFDVYLRELTIACEEGASGAAVGRAVWKEAPTLTGKNRSIFLEDVARRRMERITSLCNDLAKPWAESFSVEMVSSDWYKRY